MANILDYIPYAGEAFDIGDYLPASRNQGPGDALRHAYMAGMMSQALGSSYAAEGLGQAYEMVSNPSEYFKSGEANPDMGMDFRSNRIGAGLGMLSNNDNNKLLQMIIDNMLLNINQDSPYNRHLKWNTYGGYTPEMLRENLEILRPD